MKKISRHTLIQISLAALSGVLIWLSFPLARGITLTPLAWFCLVPLLISIRSASAGRSFWLGLIAGMIGNLGTYYWIPYCMINYAGMSKGLAYPVLLLLALMLSGYLAVFCALVRAVQLNFKLSLLLIGPLIWVSLEYIRNYFPLGGFAWAMLGSSQYKFLGAIQISELAGVWIVSWLVALVNFGSASLFQKWPIPKKAVLEFGVALFLFLANLGYGGLRIRSVDRAFAHQPEIKVAIVQGNIDQGVKWNPFFFWNTLSRHIALSQSLLKDKQDLLVWPEASITDYFNLSWENRSESEMIKQISVFDSYFLVGSISREFEGDQRLNFNSAYLLSPFAEKIAGRYDKMHLVPFGEYVPIQKLLFWVDAIAGGNTGNTTPGKKVTVFETGKFKIACVICYELIFPNLVRKFPRAGAQIMSTITNDAWFGPTSAPYQHNSNIALRAVENRVYFLRAANTGVSCICDPAGRILKQTGIFEIAALEGIVKPSPLHTPYTQYGDWFPILSLALTSLSLIGILLKKRKEKMRRTGK